VIGAEAASTRPQFSVDGVATFLVAVATVLREAATRFEETSSRITESVTSRPDLADRELVVRLQDFDRLLQEFVSLADVLSRAAGKSDQSWLHVDGAAHPAEDAVAAISIADVKERLMRQLNYSLIDLSLVPTGDETVF
jgi:hypothetical protein